MSSSPAAEIHQLASIGRLLAGIVHEINTPIGSVFSNNEVPVEESKLKRFPSGFQRRLVISNEFKGMKYVYEEGQCLGEGGFEEEFKGAEARTGFFQGAFEEYVEGGNLGFNP